MYTITNNGLLTLYNIELKADFLDEKLFTIECRDTGGQTVLGSNAASSVAGLAGYPDMGLSPAVSITCTATDSITRAEVRTQGDTYPKKHDVKGHMFIFSLLASIDFVKQKGIDIPIARSGPRVIVMGTTAVRAFDAPCQRKWVRFALNIFHMRSTRVSVNAKRAS